MCARTAQEFVDLLKQAYQITSTEAGTPPRAKQASKYEDSMTWHHKQEVGRSE